MKLSHRLKTIASFVPEGSNVADIGTDHGYIPIYLVQNHIADHAIAMDVRKGPLERAESHIKDYGLEKQIEVRLSDGLGKLLPGEADTVVIAGMGGGLLIHILEEGRHVWDTVEHFILSPQSDIGDVRRYLAENGFCIRKESMLTDEGKYYTVMDVEKGVMVCDRDIHRRYGKFLLDKRDKVLQEYLNKELYTLTVLLDNLKTQNTDSARMRCEQISDEIAIIEEAKNEMQRTD